MWTDVAANGSRFLRALKECVSPRSNLFAACHVCCKNTLLAIVLGKQIDERAHLVRWRAVRRKHGMDRRSRRFELCEHALESSLVKMLLHEPRGQDRKPRASKHCVDQRFLIV